jgi:hypothetical protein
VPAPHDDPTAARRTFAAAHIRDARSRGPIPRYGDPDWHALPYADPRRWAAVLVAAECWARDGDQLPDRLHTELADAAAASARLADEDFAQMAATVRHRAGAPTHLELAVRRGEVDPAAAERAEQEWAAFLTGQAPSAPRVRRRTGGAVRP